MRSVVGRLGSADIQLTVANEKYVAGVGGGGTVIAAVPTVLTGKSRIIDITNWGTGLACFELIKVTDDPAGKVNTARAQYVIPPVSGGVPYSLSIDIPEDEVLVGKPTVDGYIRVTEKVVLA